MIVKVISILFAQFAFQTKDLTAQQAGIQGKIKEDSLSGMSSKTLTWLKLRDIWSLLFALEFPGRSRKGDVA